MDWNNHRANNDIANAAAVGCSELAVCVLMDVDSIDLDLGIAVNRGFDLRFLLHYGEQ